MFNIALGNPTPRAVNASISGSPSLTTPGATLTLTALDPDAYGMIVGIRIVPGPFTFTTFPTVLPLPRILGTTSGSGTTTEVIIYIFRGGRRSGNYLLYSFPVP